MKLLVDMNLTPRWVDALLDAGFEAAHWSALGRAYASDSEIMDFAVPNGYIVLTNDLDFGAILAMTNAARPSVVQIRGGDLSPEEIGRQVFEALRQLGPELAEGALVTIDPLKTRVRVLPFRPIG
jgi:predicted nuclease of predicted toxin-antitoxin system